jgi:dCTP deaminase
MILTGSAIKQAVSDGMLAITPFDEKLVNPASIDLRLGNTMAGYKRWIYVSNTKATYPCESVIDVKSKADMELIPWGIPDGGFVIHPNILYLAHTAERIRTKTLVSQLMGKSSVARLGISVHQTAGYGDPGFNGQYTLEISCIHPVRLYAGMQIAQMQFSLVTGDLTDYQDAGHYTGQQSGPVASRIYTQFKEP